MRPPILSAILYAALAAFFGVDVLLSLSGSIAHDAGDPLLTAAILRWNTQHMPLTDAWWQFPIFHPTRDALAFSEHLLGLSPIASPVLWLTGSTLAAYNATLLLTFPLCGLAMYALVHRLTRRAPAAFLAGLAYAFAPYRTSQLAHIQLLATFCTPLVLLGLHGYADTGRRRWLALSGAAWLLLGAASGYLLVYGSVLVAAWVLWFVVLPRRWRDLPPIAAAFVVAAVPLVPILVRYADVHARHAFTRQFGEAAAFGADVASLLCAPPLLTFWSWLRLGCKPEGELFPGAALLVILLVGVVSWRRAPVEAGSATVAPSFKRQRVQRALLAISAVFATVALSTVVFGAWKLQLGSVSASASSPVKPFSSAVYLLLGAALLSPRLSNAARSRSVATFYILAAAGSWVLAWGPEPRFLGVQVLYQAPFAWLMRLPGVDALRVPARFWLITSLCLCVLLGLVVAQMLTRRTRRSAAALVALAAAALAMDGWTRTPAVAPPAPAPRPDLLRGSVVLELPIGEPGNDIAAVFRAVTGGWRTANGFSGYEPAGYEELREASMKGDAAVLRPFAAAGELHVLVSTDAADLVRMLEQYPGAKEVGRSAALIQYLVSTVE